MLYRLSIFCLFYFFSSPVIYGHHIENCGKTIVSVSSEEWKKALDKARSSRVDWFSALAASIRHALEIYPEFKTSPRFSAYHPAGLLLLARAQDLKELIDKNLITFKADAEMNNALSLTSKIGALMTSHLGEYFHIGNTGEAIRTFALEKHRDSGFAPHHYRTEFAPYFVSNWNQFEDLIANGMLPLAGDFNTERFLNRYNFSLYISQ